jgi:hypothetical protein
VKQDHRVYGFTSPSRTQMQVRPGYAAGGSAEAETLALGDPVSYLYLYFGEVHILGRDLLPVVDHDQVAFIEHGLGDDDHTIVGSEDRRT